MSVGVLFLFSLVVVVAFQFAYKDDEPSTSALMVHGIAAIAMIVSLVAWIWGMLA